MSQVKSRPTRTRSCGAFCSLQAEPEHCCIATQLCTVTSRTARKTKSNVVQRFRRSDTPSSVSAAVVLLASLSTTTRGSEQMHLTNYRVKRPERWKKRVESNSSWITCTDSTYCTAQSPLTRPHPSAPTHLSRSTVARNNDPRVRRYRAYTFNLLILADTSSRTERALVPGGKLLRHLLRSMAKMAALLVLGVVLTGMLA
jgi:hypothetical protein